MHGSSRMQHARHNGASDASAGSLAGGRDGASIATPLSDKSEEFRRVHYLLKMSTRDLVLSDVCVWHFGNAAQSVAFERRTRGTQTLPAWMSTRRLGEDNSLDALHHKGFSFPASGEGLTFAAGDLDIDLNEGTAQRFLLCQVGVGRAFVVDDPSEQATLPEGYDSLYLALSTSIDNDGNERGIGYRHEYTVIEPQQVLPMYLVQFFVDADGQSSEADFGAANRADDFAPSSVEKLYDRYDFFDPVLYTPVSVRDKMVGSHSTGELAQHKLISIGDAYESAVGESMKVDPIVATRQEEIKAQLSAIDTKLREVNRNSAAVEERIYKTLQEALFRLQDVTQSKMSALLSEEVELRRQLQQIEWMETFLDSQRESAAQVDFLNSWKCHVQLRGDAVRAPLRTNAILASIRADLELAGSVQVVSRSQQGQQGQQGPGRAGSVSTAPHMLLGRRSNSSGGGAPSEMRMPPPSEEEKSAGVPLQQQQQQQQGQQQQQQQQHSTMALPSDGTGNGSMTKEGQGLLHRMFSQLSTGTSLASSSRDIGNVSTRPELTPPASAGLATEPEAPGTRSESRGEEEQDEAQTAPNSPHTEPLTMSVMSPATPARFAQFSLRAEAVRRLRQLRRQLDMEAEESLRVADEAFRESKILQHPNVEEALREIEALNAVSDSESDEDEEDDGESERAEARQRRRAQREQLRRTPKVYGDAHALILSVPFGAAFQPPVTTLLYATWKPGTERSVQAIVRSMPRAELDEEDDGVEDEHFLRNLPTLVVIKANGRVFGGYADEPWRPDGLTFGGAKSFLFSSSLDIKVPFQGRKTLDPPPPPADVQAMDDPEDLEGLRGPTFCTLKSDDNVMQFGLRDLVLKDNLAACSSELEFTFGVGLRPGSDDACTLLAGSTVFKVDELELWGIESDVAQ